MLYYEKFLAALPSIKDLPEEKKRSLETEVHEWVSQLRRQKEEEDARLREEEAHRQKEQQSVSVQTSVAQDIKPTREPVQRTVSLTSRWWFWTGVGATAIFAGTAVWAGLRAKDYNDKWQQLWDDQYHDKAELYQNMTDAALGGAIVSAVATSVASWLFWRGQNQTPVPGKSAFLVPSCDGAACMLHLTFSF